MISPFKKFRVDTLFFRSFAVVIVIVVACIAWASYIISSNELVKTSSLYQQRLLDELNNEIATRLTMIEQISLSTSRDNEIISFLKDRRDQYDTYRRSVNVVNALANLTYSIPLIQGIDLYMEHPFQREQDNYIQFRDLNKLNQEPWAGAFVNNDFAWSTEHDVKSFQGEVPVLSFGRKIVYDDKYLGVLVIHIKYKEIVKILDGHTSNANRLMVDSQGRELVRAGQVLDHTELSEWINVKDEESGYVRIRGNAKIGDSLLVYSKLQDSNWTLVEISSWKQIT
ncbi:cache domain-containing protein, partial [Paenibacillus antibioticophila]|uniref:cache domain-containing protein n=1 Tax=Paenibacillus antibioticophila TaxID=1274374 RepID=UPI0005CA0E5C